MTNITLQTFQDDGRIKETRADCQPVPSDGGESLPNEGGGVQAVLCWQECGSEYNAPLFALKSWLWQAVVALPAGNLFLTIKAQSGSQ